MKVSDFTTSIGRPNTEEINDEFASRYKEFYYSKQKIVEVVPDQKVYSLITTGQGLQLNLA